MKCQRETDARKFDHHTLQVMRMQAVRAHREGVSAPAIAKTMGVSDQTVYRWLRDYFSGGQQALLAKPIPGRPQKLTTEQLAWVAKAVREESPLQHKFAFGLWTLKLIRELIRRQFDVSLAISSTWKLMQLMGFSSQKPLYVAWQQDSALVRRWEAEAFPAIRAQAKALGASIYFADESAIRSDYHRGSTWAPTGQTPVVTATGRRFSLNMLSAISTRGELNFMVHEGRVDASVFIDFLGRLLIGATAPILLVVDGHPVHHSKRVREFVASLNGQLTLHFLPPYSPHLNPAETVWSNVKGQVARRIATTKEELRAFVDDAFIRLGALPELVKSFFQQPECRYILG